MITQEHYRKADELVKSFQYLPPDSEWSLSDQCAKEEYSQHFASLITDIHDRREKAIQHMLKQMFPSGDHAYVDAICTIEKYIQSKFQPCIYLTSGEIEYIDGYLRPIFDQFANEELFSLYTLAMGKSYASNGYTVGEIVVDEVIIDLCIGRLIDIGFLPPNDEDESG